MLFSAADLRLANDVIEGCRAVNARLVTAESCTGGLVTALLTEIAGASDVVDAGFVTYSNEAKIQQLGVDPGLIDTHGAVSEPTARAMAEGALKAVRASTIALSVTGVAGPGGGSMAKPVGTVHFAVAADRRPTLSHHQLFAGSRQSIRLDAMRFGLTLIGTAATQG